MHDDSEPVCRIRPGNYPRLATLGDVHATTCSVDLAEQWLEGRGSILGYLSFKAAMDAVVDGVADFVLVPGAYPEMRSVIFDERLHLEDAFVGQLPAMVLAEAPVPELPRAQRIYFHPALRDLALALGGMTRESLNEHITVSSNPLACERVLEDPAAWALTNRTAAQRYGVTELRVLRDDWRMPTSVFKRRGLAEDEIRLARLAAAK